MDTSYGDAGGQDNGQKSFTSSGVNSADDASKIFVGGLSWETTSDDLKAYFENFGTVTDCTIKTDPNTGRPRGFGFVVFADAASVDSVLAVQEPHSLGGKNIDPKRAKRLGPEPVKKVFVGGLDPNTSETEVREYFGQFGTIEELILPIDKINNVRKSFAFITFDSEEPVEQLCSNPMHNVGGKSVEVKKATQKPENGFGGGRGGGRGGFGAPRGGGGRGRGGRGGPKFGGGYGQGGWDTTGGYGGGYDYSPYGQAAPNPYAQPDPYAQQYGAGYDYSGWYGNGAQAAQPNIPSYGGRGRGGVSSGGDARYQPYSR